MFGEGSDPTDGRFYVLSADMQEHGHGFNKREWVSPEGGLYMTMAYKVPAEYDAAKHGNASKVIAISVCECLQSDFDIRESGILWPTHVLIRGNKASGIYTSFAVTEAGECILLLAGIGVNVNMPETQAEEHTAKDVDAMGIKFGTMQAVLGKELSVEKVRNAISWQLAYNLRLLFGYEDGKESIMSFETGFLDKYRKLSSPYVGRMIEWNPDIKGDTSGDRTVTGRFIELNEKGELVFEDDKGARTTYNYGRIRLLLT